jgi:predicted Zn-dependent protease
MMNGSRAARALLVLALLSTASCATNPATGARQLSLMSEAQEIQIGQQQDEALVGSGAALDDPDLVAYVDGVGQRIAAVGERPELPWSFRIMDDPTVNAFAMPGGYLYVTRGILAHLTSEAQLATVLGHEVGHVTARHSVEQISRMQLAQVGYGLAGILAPRYAGLLGMPLQLLFLSYSRSDESESDMLGLRYMMRTNYDPRVAPEVFLMLGRASGGQRIPEWQSTHPDPERRAENLRDTIATLTIPADARLGQAEYVQSLDGLMFGENPREGFFRDNEFLHPEMAFRIVFPEGWAAQNGRTAVQAMSPQEDAVVGITVADGSTPEEAARAFYAQEEVRGSVGRRVSAGGLPAVEGSFQIQQTDQMLTGRGLWVQTGDIVLFFVGVGTEVGWQRNSASIERSLRSVARVTDRAVLDMQPVRLDVVTLPRAMTVEQFARRYPSVVDVEQLVQINQWYDGVELPAGTAVKRVVR